jgi:predicted alpha/beta hydrolase family esterase
MKNVLILHGTDGCPTENWFDWLKTKLEKKSWKVWVPQLPGANRPNIQRYNDFLLANNDWKFNEESVLIGHSSGAVAILGLLQALPEGGKVNICCLVGSFKNNLGWDALDELFLEPFNFDLIKTKANKFVFIHSDNDPYCPLEHAQYLSEKLDGELIVKPGQFHFSIKTAGDRYREFPFLLEKIVGK